MAGATGLKAGWATVRVVGERLVEETRTGRRMTTAELVADLQLSTAVVRDALNQLQDSGDALYDGFAWVSIAPDLELGRSDKPAHQATVLP